MTNLINGLTENGVAVHVLVGPGEYPELATLESPVRLHRLTGTKDVVGDVRSLIGSIGPWALLSNRDDAHAVMAAVAAGLKPRPRVAMRVGINVPEKLRQMNPVARWRRRGRLIKVYRQADLLIANSKGVCDGLRVLLRTACPAIETLHNPLDLDQARRLAAEPATHPWLADKRYPVIVSVGRLARMKDQATLVRAVAQLPAHYRLVIFGEGRQRGSLLALAARLGMAERFSLPGHSDNPFTHVARADLFVLSSQFEGSPNVLTEALAVGTPAVATDCPSGPREILGDGLYGELVPVGDPSAMAAAIRRCFGRSTDRARLAEAVKPYELTTAVAAYQQALGLKMPDEQI
jgi:glycosyltransferase involved in cell wall biosynthesis